MPIHSIAFWVCAFFLIGVFFAGILGQFWITAISGILISLYFIFFKKYYFALFALCIIAGAFYYSAFDYFSLNKNIPFGVKTDFTGVIRKAEQSATAQKMVLELESPYRGNMRINAQRDRKSVV